MVKKKRPDDAMKTVAIIPGAGAGIRMGAGRAKQFLELDNRPLLALTLEKFQICPVIDSIILVAPPEEVEFCKIEIIERYGLNKVGKIVPGGERRQDSVRLGIEASGGEYELVMIHDGVRPFIETGLIEQVVDSAMENRAVITALPAKDTVKKIDKDGFVLKTYERKQVCFVQTPQIFRYEDIMAVHQKALLEGWEDVTDDALLVEKIGIPVKVILGSEDNIKVTTPHDMELGNLFLNRVKKEE
ncbi:2-C-methyl-D-erythritol 4-phosphate cytidylyltransferase [Thermodesulfobacteriota bacterium]